MRLAASVWSRARAMHISCAPSLHRPICLVACARDALVQITAQQPEIGRGSGHVDPVDDALRVNTPAVMQGLVKLMPDLLKRQPVRGIGRGGRWPQRGKNGGESHGSLWIPEVG